MNPQDCLQGLVKGFGMATESVGITGAFAHFLLEDTVDGSENPAG